MTRTSPGASVPRLQGKGVLQAPPFETNVTPGGAGSVTITPVAVEGPALVMVMVNDTGLPAVISPGGPTLSATRSADAKISVVSVLLLLPGSGSVVPTGGVTVAVLLSVPSAA